MSAMFGQALGVDEDVIYEPVKELPEHLMHKALEDRGSVD